MKKIALLLSLVWLTCSLADAQNRQVGDEGLPHWTLRRALNGHTQSVHAVAFSPDGKTVASAGWDRKIILWDVETGAQKMVLKHGYHPHQVMFSPDGQSLYSSGGDGTIKKWNLQTGKARALVSGRNEIVNLSLSSDGALLACDCRLKAVEILDTKTGALKFTAPHGDYVHAVALSPDSKLLAVAGGGEHRPVELWHVQSGKVARKFTDVRYASSVAFSLDSTILTIGSQVAENVKFFNPTTGELLQTWSKDNYRFSEALFSPAGHLLAGYPGISGRIYLYDWLEKRWTGLLNTNRVISGVAFSPDGKRLAAAGYDDNSVTIWSNPASDSSK